MDYDSGYHLLFSNPPLVADLLRRFAPAAWVRQLNLSSLRRVNTKFHADDLNRRESDMIYRLELIDGSPLYLYLLLEFQSRTDPWMAVRVGAYVFLLYQHLIREKQVSLKTGLPPVFPLVLYNGDGAWQAATVLSELIHLPKTNALWPLQPQISYYLLEERLHPLETGRSLTGLLFELGNCRQRAQLKSVVSRIVAELAQPNDSELKRAFLQFIKQVLSRKNGLPFNGDNITELSEINEMLSTRLDQWEKEFLERGIQQGLEQGLEKGKLLGKQQGESKLLYQLLTHRFGPLPEWATEKLANADSATLESWGLTLLEAKTLERVFK